jgi:thiamine-phosphate pyrophosphorylase
MAGGCKVKGAHLRVPDPPLLLVTDRRQARWPLAYIVTAAVKAGCRWISVREKDLPADEQVLLARSLLPITRAHGARLTMHGDEVLAAAAGADGVHLSAGSNPAAARALLGAQKLIGVSIHTVTEAEGIDPSAVDYVIAGPAFETASKPGYGPELGRKGLSAIAQAARVPVLAIGGINTARIADLISEGAAGVGVMGSVMRAPNPLREVEALVAILRGFPAARST